MSRELNTFQNNSTSPHSFGSPSLSLRPPLPRLQSPTNYFSNYRESPEISTESLLSLNLLNGVQEFNMSQKSNTFQNNTPQFESDKLNLQSYSKTFLSEIFNSEKNNSSLPQSPYGSPPPLPHLFGPPPPYVPRQAIN